MNATEYAAFATLTLLTLAPACARDRADVAPPAAMPSERPAEPRAQQDMVPEPARPADSLVESIGVAAHWGFHNTVYHQKWDEVQKLLGESGIRIVRDGLDHRMDELWKLYGIRGIFVTSPDKSWDQYLELWRQKRHLIAAIEGSNEVNGGWAKVGYTYQGKGWPEGPRIFQEDLYKRVKGDPALKDIPVIALSTAYKNFGTSLAPLRSFDYANAHSYAGGGIPSRSIDFREPYLLLGRGAVYPPLAATESGYHTCLGETRVIAGNHPGVSHAAHRKYIPRHVAEYFNAGHRWTVIYELAAGRPKKAEQEDPEAAFGLLMPDATPKPAYFALKDLIALLSESKWDAAAGRWIHPESFPTRAMTFSLRGAPESVHHTLLQRSDGSFQLLLWNEVPSIDLRAKKDIRNAPVPVRLALRDPAARITVTRLGPDALPPAHFESVREIDLAVPDEVIVVGIRLAKPLRPASLAPPGDVEVKPGPGSVELSWPVRKGADAFWVSLNQRNLGPAQLGPDGKARFRMTGLLPAMTYPFEIVAVSRDGGVSVPAKVSATTVDASPDLVVLSLKTIPESPKEGDTITFSAVVENRGNAATEEGVTVGAKFGVDGKTVCWSDRFHGPLAPGQKVELKPNNGPTGKTSWVMTRGCHNVTVQVDDLNRITEFNEGNNRRVITINSGTGPDLVIKAVTVKEARQGKPLVVEVTVANVGSEPVPKGSRVGATLYAIDGEKRPKVLSWAISRDGLPVGGNMPLTIQCDSSLVTEQHKFLAIVDDVNRIAELDKTNNRAEFEIANGTPAEPRGDAPSK